jgi:hypothetical protein
MGIGGTQIPLNSTTITTTAVAAAVVQIIIFFIIINDPSFLKNGSCFSCFS